MNCRYIVITAMFVCSALMVVQPVSAESSACKGVDSRSVIYVDAAADGRADGTSWEYAFNSLNDAIAAARKSDGGDQIWLAGGTYNVEEVDGGTFVLPGNVGLYGGFSGDEFQLNQRDTSRNETVLDGGGIARHVLFADGVQDVVLSGLTVAGGRATGELEADVQGIGNEVRGGGMLVYSSDIVLCDVRFVDNEARKFGGGYFQEGGTLQIAGSLFEDNRVIRGSNVVHEGIPHADTDGGGIAIHNSEHMTIRNSLFRRNIAGDDGGAIATRKTDVDILDVKFHRNKAIGLVTPVTLPSITEDFMASTGGAISIENEYNPVLGGDQRHKTLVKHSEFIENRSAIGGAGFLLGATAGESVIDECTFYRNGGSGVPAVDSPPNEKGVAFGRGAGVFLIVGTRSGDREVGEDGEFVRPLHHSVVSNSYFNSNTGGYSGALVLIGLDSEVNDTVFYNNVSRQRAGAILSLNFIPLFDQIAGLDPVPGTVSIKRSTFVRNKSLGILETLQAEVFPGISTPEEQTFGGGAISNDSNGLMSIADSIFIKNSSENGDGGAIHNATTPVAFYGTLNRGLPVTYPSNLVIENTGFFGNKVIGVGSGGAIANGGNRANGVVDDALGADLRDVARGSSVEIHDSTFFDNESVASGGAIANWNGSQLSITRSRFSHNEAEDNGGAIAAIGRESNLGELNITKSVFKYNEAESGEGGGVYAEYTTGYIKLSKFLKNEPNDVFDVTGSLEYRSAMKRENRSDKQDDE